MRRLAALALCSLALSLAACSKSSSADAGPVDAGLPPADDCNSKDDAKANADCQLTTGMPVEGFIYPSGDHDWYHLSVPTLPPRAILTVTGMLVNAPGSTMPALSSPVTLQLLVYQGDALTIVGMQSDPEPRGSPSATTVSARISQPGDYYVLVQDDTSDNDDPTMGDADPRHPYALTATLSSDPDVNEPNDTPAQATVIDVSSGSGMSSGYLATTGDVDVYAIDVPSSDAPPNRTLLYLGFDAPDIDGGPPTAIQLSYTISLDNDGGVVAAGHTTSPIGEQKLGVSKVVPQAGRYFVTVEPYLAHPDTDPPVPGDPRFQYSVTVKLMPDLDTNEPNDTQATGTPVNFANAGDSQTLEGRIASIPDPDWYNVNMAATGQNMRLRYSVTYDASAANQQRFPPAGSPDDKQVTLSLTFPDASTCQATTCPGIDPWDTMGCAYTTPQCIYSYRLENPDVLDLSNFQGEIPIPAHASPVTYSLLFEDQSNDGADDRAYTLQLDYVAEGSDDSAAYHSDGSSAIGVSAPFGGYSQDPGNAGAAQGYFGSGHGVNVRNQAPNAALIPIYSVMQTSQDMMETDSIVLDYDAVNDTDFFQINLPQSSALISAATDAGPAVYAPLSWSSAWTIPPAQGQMGGQRPYDLEMAYFFCDTSENPTCDPNGDWEYLALGYSDASVLNGWDMNMGPGFTYDSSSGRFAATSGECFCIEPRFVAGGVMYLGVTGVARTSYNDAQYTVNTSFSSYPQGSCPVDDGGLANSCHFCDQYGGGCQTVHGLTIPRDLP